jgi:hypothetical protein
MINTRNGNYIQNLSFLYFTLFSCYIFIFIFYSALINTKLLSIRDFFNPLQKKYILIYPLIIIAVVIIKSTTKFIDICVIIGTNKK